MENAHNSNGKMHNYAYSYAKTGQFPYIIRIQKFALF